MRQRISFCTIEPNSGVVPMPDLRLEKIAGIVSPAKVIPAAMEFVDIAGLVEGASRGEVWQSIFGQHKRN